MSVLKELYEHVKGIINNDVPEVVHFDVWNENVQNDGIETPYNTPAVFYEVVVEEWDEPMKGSTQECTDKYPAQHGTVDFVLHIIIRKNESSDIDTSELRHYDVAEAVYKKLFFTTFDNMEGNIIRTSGRQDINVRVLRDYQVVYSCRLLENADTRIGDEIIDANDPIGTVDFTPEIEPQIDQPFIPGRGIKIVYP